MNLEQREKANSSIRKQEGLLAYAVRHGDGGAYNALGNLKLISAGFAKLQKEVYAA